MQYSSSGTFGSLITWVSRSPIATGELLFKKSGKVVKKWKSRKNAAARTRT
jgi:hypothetical protein